MTYSLQLIPVAIIAYLSMTMLIGVYFSRRGSGSSSNEFLYRRQVAGTCGDSHERRGFRYEQLPAFLVTLIVNVVVSLAAGAPEDEVIRTFEQL